jgi:phospholipid/cholesterol/gamma-HCH transport system permease protein
VHPNPDKASIHLTIVGDGETLCVTLGGLWRSREVGDIEREIDALDFSSHRRLRIIVGAVVPDLAGAWAVRRLEQRAAERGLSVDYEGERPVTVALVDAALGDAAAVSAPPAASRGSVLSALGHRAFDTARDWRDGLAFLGEATVRFLRGVFDRRAWHPISVARHVYDTGITAIPIVALIAFLISVIIAYMGAQQLRKFGADIFVVDLVTVGVLREMGVLLTAIIVAGRSGSAFAAEIGAMNLNEEVDALRATGVQPIEVLVLPRALGLVIALPLLTVIADAVGILGGGLLCNVLLDMPLVQYVQRVDESIGDYTFWVGIIKAPVFAILIAIVGTFRGMQVRGSSRELGRLTTVAVVQSIFLVILADALFAVLFMEIDI